MPTAPSARGESSGAPTVWDRVMVVRSPKRTLTVTVLPARRASRKRVPTASAMRTTFSAPRLGTALRGDEGHDVLWRHLEEVLLHHAEEDAQVVGVGPDRFGRARPATNFKNSSISR